MITKRALAAAITRYECKYNSATEIEQQNYWFCMMEAAQEQLDILNLEQSDEN